MPGELSWLQPGSGFWIETRNGASFRLEPALPERIFPYDENSIGAFVGSGGAGIATAPWPFRYDESSFDSAGFDIDRPPIGCYGVEDTDAWDANGELVRDPSGWPGADGFIDPPLSGRYRMMVTIGAPITGSSSGNGQVLSVGGLGIFMLANRPDVPRPESTAQSVISKASAAPMRNTGKPGDMQP